MSRLMLVGFALVCSLTPAQARITSLTVLGTEAAFDGQIFGTVGAYQRVRARVEGVLDPKDPRNAIIQDLDLAPKDNKGMVHYSTDVDVRRQ